MERNGESDILKESGNSIWSDGTESQGERTQKLLHRDHRKILSYAVFDCFPINEEIDSGVFLDFNYVHSSFSWCDMSLSSCLDMITCLI